MSRYGIGNLVLIAILAAVAVAAHAAQEPEDGGHPDADIRTAPVRLDGRDLFRVRGVTSLPAEERAGAIAGRIEALAADAKVAPDSVQAVEDDGLTRIMSGERRIMVVFEADAKIEQVSRQTLARVAAERIARAVADYRRERSTEYLVEHGLRSAVATLVLGAAVALTIWLSRWLKRLLERRYRDRVRSLGIQSFEILRAERIWAGLRAAIITLRVLVIAGAAFLFLDVVLSGFPWTRGFAHGLVDLVVGPLTTMGRAFVADIPDLMFLVVLAFVLRFLLRLMRLFFETVARGSVNLAGFEADWAMPTYKIARFGLVAFALVIAYPYIPGSGSDAFKGVSLFLGVVLSLGSSSAISNVIAGYMLTYRRAFRVGDRVQIGEVTGDVTEMRLQVTHLRTLKNEEVTIPNSAILNGQVVNFSALAVSQGLILHTTVGIGYETPWRQVEAMLLMAAGRTAGLLTEPAPFVLQKALGDFCVTYEINARCNDARAMNDLYSDLHRNILDVFNEYGVQIMTPAYEGDPEQPKLVPREQWYLAPAQKREGGA
ncbi:MAG TPA: mechanosensitive ion channel family protein [Rhodocyclaceae bacterium]|nr:mechanosensitive ion channel family protein [Rhodocyclaceae bacterium]